jgi:thioesterase domain-containing protein
LVQRYRPKPYPGRVLLFRSSLPSVGLYGDPQFGWGELFNGGLEVCDIPGDHRDMFLEPYVGNTATKLGACLR